MPPIISQFVKFTTKTGFTLASSEFAALRTAVAQRGVKEQYFGLDTDNRDTLLWVIQWPMPKGPQETAQFKESVNALDARGSPNIVYLPFAHESLPRPALTAPVCELCFLHVKDKAAKVSLAHSLEKTFTDCYFADGFGGGSWSVAQNDDRLYFYYLGWESRELHGAFSKTELFAEELDKIMPHTDGAGFNFVHLVREEEMVV
ncbi:Glycoside hydrolase family 5 protein [Mycena chlorophos]|uniref:Glycoside hydrolase family 5 protein n=1 Tax=Mycena chlorophos TaxID=658473 RepID=A0A8H6WBN7_MYCCL|nr:Glycoside hydrolase family 5 protein [Mycena chlorophos]